MKSLALAALALVCSASASFAYEVPGKNAPEGAEVYIVTFNEPGALHYRGDIPGYKATSNVLRSKRKNKGALPEVKAYLQHLDAKLTQHSGAVSVKVGRQIEPLLTYKVRSVGMAVLLTATEAKAVSQLANVSSVRKDKMYELVTDAGPQWIGASSIWDGTATGGAPANHGEGVLIGVLDTGVNLDHPSFSDSPEDGHTFVNPFGSGNFIGDCDATFVCNDKLVGAWDFSDPFGEPGGADGPEDNNGHGSHTASTAAGNAMAGPFTDTASGNLFPVASMSGVAPHANLITYDVCTTSCPGASIQGGIDQALLDGVDVINFSISGGLNPWVDFDRGFLDLVASGAVVAAAAGNTSQGNPDPVGDVNHRGPWVLTVANQTHDRAQLNDLINMSSTGVSAPSEDIPGASATLGYGPAPIVYAGDFPNANDPGGDPAQCLESYPAGTWTNGEIVLCDRGAIARVAKCSNVASGGAQGCVLADVVDSPGRVADPHVIPATHVNFAEGEILRSWLATGSDHTAEITDSAIVSDPALGSHISGGSLRGPNNSFDVTKPDIGAPGTNIFAAHSDSLGAPPQLTFLSGTSMASPHAAGASALLTSLRPDWSPSEIKSALMLTARPGFDEDGNPANPDIEGSGTIDLSKAAETGLVMPEHFGAYLAANPATGGDPGTLNLPSMRANDCNGSCSWERRVCAALDADTAWTVNAPAPNGITVNVAPGSFDLLGGDTIFTDGLDGPVSPNSSCQTLDIEVIVNDQGLVNAGDLVFSGFTLSEDSAAAPDATMTIAILPTAVD